MQSVPGSFEEWFVNLGPGEKLPIVIVGLILGTFAIVFLITIVIASVCQMHKHRLENALKRELLERGMSAEEIATVVRARPGRNAAVSHIKT